MSRVRVNLNREWRFIRQDLADAQAIDFDDGKWQRVGLPHTFDLPYFRTPEFYVGVGWYRKRFALSLSAGRVLLEFEGAFQIAEVFVNGKRVGEHRGGYTGFFFDITDFVYDGDNVLAVRVDNNWNPQIAPRAGEHIFSGGIYRDVYLGITNDLRVTWHGTSVTTPLVSRESATVNIKTELSNSSCSKKSCAVRSTLFGPDGDEVAATFVMRTISPHTTIQVDQTTKSIPSPRLWHPDHPYLYRVRTEIYEGEDLVDEYETPFGIRWFQWTPDRGFFLNGEHLYLRGANVHHDHAGWGIAITQAACERDVRLIKEAGFNFVRGAHYPHHPAFADACDRLGLIFWSENCFWGKGGFGPEGYWNASAYPVNPDDFQPFEQHCRQTLAEMIRINRNHPSIVIWSMTNEAFFTHNLDRAKNLMRTLVKLSHELDPTRPAAIGGAQRGDVDKLGDVAGYNGDGARLFIDPDVPNMVSEYGAITKPHDAYEPFFGELQPERYPWRAGEAIWAGFDYGSIAGRQGLKGILRHDRLPKQSWHWYRDHYTKGDPALSPSPGSLGDGRREVLPERLHLATDRTTINNADATEDAQIIVTVCDRDGNRVSHSPPITLAITSGPGEFPTGRSITFDAATDISIVDGQAAIAFRSYAAGASTILATSPGLAAATITITTLGEPAFVDGETKLVEPRPYVPPQLSAAAIAAMQNVVNVALNRPCRAGEERADHPARLANDGNAETYWEAESNRAWWTVDLEGFYQLSGVRLIFHSPQNHQYLIETSQDGSHWIHRIDRTTTARTDAIRNDIFDPGTIARYVRATFESPLKLCELEIHGVLSVR